MCRIRNDGVARRLSGGSLSRKRKSPAGKPGRNRVERLVKPREDFVITTVLFRTLKVSTVLALAALALGAASSANAEALRDKWCKDVHIRFFVGGAEGDAFGTIVYNGAKQAADDTGAQVDYVFSGWDVEKMIQQLREAVALIPTASP